MDTKKDYFCLNSAHMERAVCGVYIGRLCKVECKLETELIEMAQRTEKRMKDYCNRNCEVLNGIVNDIDSKV